MTPITHVHRRPRVRRRSRARHRLALALALVAAASLLTGMVGPPGAAAGPSLAALAAPGDEGGSKSLREQLDAASRGFIEAKAKLKKSQDRQKELAGHLKQIEAELVTRTESLGDLAGEAYRTGRLGPVTALLNAGSPDAFLDRATVLGTVAANEDRELRELLRVKDSETRAKLALDAAVREQQKQLTVMAKRKAQAERALRAAAVGGGATGGPGSTSGSTRARSAPRNSDGSWPGESCTVNDPTTGGCITPRTLHAMNQAKAAGFTRFVSCYRPTEDGGEHPRGRACDFAAQRGGFGGEAQGGDRAYGNNLAGYFVRNADRLGVLYVIWFRQIWLPSSGWRAYQGGGSPSGDHTNHVHLSVF